MLDICQCNQGDFPGLIAADVSVLSLKCATLFTRRSSSDQWAFRRMKPRNCALKVSLMTVSLEARETEVAKPLRNHRISAWK